MAEFFSWLWYIVSFFLGIAWSIVWFILSDLLSTLLWLLIAVWVAFVLRYRSFSAASLAMLRYTRYGLNYFWRWIRKKPGDGMIMPSPEPVTKIVKEYRQHIPFGYVSLSNQMNVTLVLFLVILANI